MITSSLQNNPIGFFDSGVGGLTILSAFRKVLPNENCIFLGDTKNMPYGEKTKDQLIEFSSDAFSFFERKGVKAVVMACNTTSAVVYDELKDKYNFKLYPLIQSVSKLLANLPVNKIGVFATPATVNSHAYTKWINKYNSRIDVIEIPCPEWVKIVENNETETQNALNSVKEKMEQMLKYNPDKIVLGCTHYPYLTEQLSKYASKERFINPANIYAQYIKSDMADSNLLNNLNIIGKDEFYVTANSKKFTNAGNRFYNVDNVLEVNVNIL